MERSRWSSFDHPLPNGELAHIRLGQPGALKRFIVVAQPGFSDEVFDRAMLLAAKLEKTHPDDEGPMSATLSRDGRFTAESSQSGKWSGKHAPKFFGKKHTEVRSSEMLQEVAKAAHEDVPEPPRSHPSAYRAPKREMTPQDVDGMTSNSEWTGVPVATLLNEVGVQRSASWMLAEGGDAARLSRSIPMTKMMDDAIIACAQNGEPVRMPNGYPARLLLPGYEGNTCIKWIRRLKAIDQPNMSRGETSKYTDPLPDGTARQFSFWWPTPFGRHAARAPTIASTPSEAGSWSRMAVSTSEASRGPPQDRPCDAARRCGAPRPGRRGVSRGAGGRQGCGRSPRGVVATAPSRNRDRVAPRSGRSG